MGFIRGLRNSLVMKTGTEKCTAHRSTQRKVGRETQRGRSEKCMGGKAQRNTQKGTSVLAFKTHPHIPRWCPHKIVTTPTTTQHNQQHKLNTVVGLDMKMTLQTPPHQPPTVGEQIAYISSRGITP